MCVHKLKVLQYMNDVCVKFNSCVVCVNFGHTWLKMDTTRVGFISSYSSMVPVLCLWAFCGIPAIAESFHKDIIVEIKAGHVRGVDNGVTQAFKGVPYASPPVGSLRWQPPQPPKTWRPAVLNAQADAPGCPQVGCGKLTPPIACPQTVSEDCLYLNVYAPSSAKNGSNLPVMVYVHGGNFFFMSGSSPLFDGGVLAQTGNVIVVTMNYRLGALGFLVTGNTSNDARGNYGLYDQIMALKWVNVNIGQFGGDPNQVTLFGQSAGAQSVLQHMTVEEIAGLFHKVILESSPIALPYKTYTEAFVLGGLLAESLGCEVREMACLRSKPADQVATAALSTRSEVASLKFLELFEPYGPYIDGTFVKGQPLDVYRSGQYIKKPMIIGTTREETVLYIYGSYNKTVNVLEYITLLLIERPDKFIEIIEHYPPALTGDDQRENLVNVSTDLVFGCPTRNLTRTLVGQGSADVWLYLWDHAFSFPGWGPVTFCEGRVCHGTEIVYVFHTADKGNFTFTPDEEVLSQSIMKYWTNFAWTSDPNKGHNQPSSATAEEIARKASAAGRAREFGKQGGVIKMAVEIENSVRAEKIKLRLGYSTTNGGPPAVWPQYNSASQWSAMHFQSPQNEVIENYKADKCDFWDSIGYSFSK